MGGGPVDVAKYMETRNAVSNIRSINARNFADSNKLAMSKDRYWDERRSPESLVGVPWIDAIDLREEETGSFDSGKGRIVAPHRVFVRTHEGVAEHERFRNGQSVDHGIRRVDEDARVLEYPALGDDQRRAKTYRCVISFCCTKAWTNSVV